MPVDVVVEAVIGRPPAQVSAFATEPTNAPLWYVNIKSATADTPPPIGVGSCMTFTARFLGKALHYTYEVVEHVPGKRFVMRTAQGPFPMETTYTWEPVDGGKATRMTLRNRGEPMGFSKVAAPVMASAMRRATTKDLARLKERLEGDPRDAR